MAARFRTAFYKLVPANLSREEGEQVLWSLAAIKDMFLERMRQGLEARFPSRTGPTALALIGKDRGIPRGRSETAEHYAARLKRWRAPRGHRTRGSPFALLEQVAEYWGGLFCQSVDNSGNVFQRNEQGVEGRFASPISWNWDGHPEQWSRFWLRLYPQPEHPEIKAWKTWGEETPWGGSFNPDVTIGQQGVTPADCAAMARLVRPPIAWKPAGTRAMWALLVLEEHGLESPTPIVPDGTWGTPYGRAEVSAVIRFWRITA